MKQKDPMEFNPYKYFVLIMPYNFISGTKYSVKHIILKYN